MDNHRTPSPGYQLFILVLSLYAVVALGLQTVIPADSEVRDIFHFADLAVCAVFFADFMVSMYRAPNRWLYFRTWGWLDLLSSIPYIEAARFGRFARIFRVIRVIRGLRASKVLLQLVVQKRSENSFMAATLVAFGLVVGSSIAILQFEKVPGANIHTGQDAAWWAVATITTVGYGDLYPVTGAGRAVAAALMAGGVGLFGTFSGFLAVWFLGSDKQTDATAAEIASLREEIAALRSALAQPGSNPATRP